MKVNLSVLRDLWGDRADWDALESRVNMSAREEEGGRRLLEWLQSSSESHKGISVTKEGKVILGEPTSGDSSWGSRMNGWLTELKPWRKGPFNLCGFEIDAEWCGNLKWDRLTPYLESLENKIVADVGCNNGYFSFRMLEHAPRFVIGMEPQSLFRRQWDLLNHFSGAENLLCTPWSVEDLGCLKGCLDVVFCMGVLYHCTDPLQGLRAIHQSLTRKGWAVIESQTIPGEDSIFLFPRKTYAGARGIYGVPTTRALENMISRAGFRRVECISDVHQSVSEQRETPWMFGSSLADHLDPLDPERTCEGYPAPRRAAFLAWK